MFINDTLIISKKIIAAHQLANILEASGFLPRVEHHIHTCLKDIDVSLSVLITDIDDPDVRGLEIARRFLARSYHLAWFALCSGGNTPAMQQARSLMVGGFFFMSESGMALDCKRGSAQFLQPCRETTPHHGVERTGRRPMIASFQPYYA